MSKKKLYIQGLVKTADTVRRGLTRPVSTIGKEHLRSLVVDSIQQVDRILERHGAKIDSLPAPTRRAYQFLSSLNFDSIKPVPTTEAEGQASGNVSLVGLMSFWDGILAKLARPISAEKADTLHRSISSASGNIKCYMNDNDLTFGDLTSQSRAIRGWLALFSERTNFDMYVVAATRAKPILEASMQRAGRFQLPAMIQFRPLTGLYRLRGYRDGTRIVLPTPMLCFSDSLFASLADAAFNGGSKQRVVEATCSDEYQSIQAELDAVSGVEEHSAGVHHDLGSSFDRVNEKYFDGCLARPRLTWSRTFTGRKFGHYDHVGDTVMISRTLDDADVQVFVVDFIMYHELLHKKPGVAWQNGRRAVHTPAFRREEKRFEQYAAAEAALTALAKRHG